MVEEFVPSFYRRAAHRRRGTDPVSAMTAAPPVVQADFDALLELLEQETMREVVTMFAASAPDRIAVAARGIETSDGRSVATAFHTLRSGCGQLGARQLEEYCALAERAAKTGDLDGAGVLLEQVRQELERCLAWFGERGWVTA